MLSNVANRLTSPGMQSHSYQEHLGSRVFEPKPQIFNGDPAGPDYLDVRASLITHIHIGPTQTLLPELGMQNFGGTLAMSWHEARGY